MVPYVEKGASHCWSLLTPCMSTGGEADESGDREKLGLLANFPLNAPAWTPHATFRVS